MEKTPHILLVGEGAKLFAVQQGFPLETLNTPESVAEWERLKAKKRQPAPPAEQKKGTLSLGGQSPFDAAFHGLEDGHDTVAVLARDEKGSLAGVCTTSGLPLKLPGRVGDSPLIGHGLYVDNSAGAAGATGVGEEVIRIGGSMLIVEAMRSGKSAQEACELAVRKVNRLAVQRGVHPAQVAFLALDARGRIGASCTQRTNFHYAVARPGNVELIKAWEIGVEEK
jgi:isoaspartyl peptidase/L-asparaginase-like protein (Ntn-hydrolase superfamily)